MAILVADKAPTLEDAARAAEAIAAADPHIVRVVVFGSVAKQTQRPSSDIDLIAITEARQLRPTLSGPFVDAVLDTLDTAEPDGTHTNWRLAPYLGRSDSFQQMITPENAAHHIRAAADLLEHAIAAVAESPLRPAPIPADEPAALARYQETIDYLHPHATPDYRQTGALPPPAAE